MTNERDPLQEINFQQWTLNGTFLIAPQGIPARARPELVVRCQPGRHNFGHTRGTFISGYIYVGAIVGGQNDYTPGDVGFQFRLDDGKLQSAAWQHSTDFSSVFFSSEDFNNFLFGHMLPHKTHTNPPVKKVIVGLQQYLGGEVEMEFDMPDPTAVGNACGAIWHRKRSRG